LVKKKPKLSKKTGKKAAVKKSVKKSSKKATLKKGKTTSAKKVVKQAGKIKPVVKKKVVIKKKTVAVKKVESSVIKKTSPEKISVLNKDKGKIITVKKPVSPKIVDKKSLDTATSIQKIKEQILRAQTLLADSMNSQQIKKQKKYKPNKKIKYSTSELKHFRNIIENERRAILESAKANMEALVDNESGEYKGDNLTYSTHMAEQGTDEMEREKNYMFVQRDEKYLGYLQEALMRIDQGTYGICIDCKDEPKNYCKTCPLIQKERLELVPITQHCIECKNLRG